MVWGVSPFDFDGVDVPGAALASPPAGVQAENADASIAAFAGRIA